MKKLVLACALILSLPAISVCSAWASQAPSETNVMATSVRVQGVKKSSNGSVTLKKMFTVWYDDGVWYQSDGDNKPHKATSCSVTINGNYYNYCTHDGYYFNYGG